MKPIDRLREIVKEEGSQIKAAKRLDISAAQLSDILNNRRGVSKQLAKKMGFHLEFIYKHNGGKHE